MLMHQCSHEPHTLTYKSMQEIKIDQASKIWQHCARNVEQQASKSNLVCVYVVFPCYTQHVTNAIKKHTHKLQAKLEPPRAIYKPHQEKEGGGLGLAMHKERVGR